MPHPLHLLREIQIADPCPIPWERMAGNDQARHCSRCEQTVYDLSTMTAVEASTLLAAHRENACVRFQRRTDGTVVTRDSPPSRPRWHGIGQLLLAIASWLGLASLHGCGTRHGKTTFVEPREVNGKTEADGPKKDLKSDKER